MPHHTPPSLLNPPAQVPLEADRQLAKALRIMEFGLRVHYEPKDGKTLKSHPSSPNRNRQQRPRTAGGGMLARRDLLTRPRSALRSPGKQQASSAGEGNGLSRMAQHVAVLCNQLAAQKMAENNFGTAQVVLRRAMRVAEMADGVRCGATPLLTGF